MTLVHFVCFHLHHSKMPTHKITSAGPVESSDPDVIQLAGDLVTIDADLHVLGVTHVGDIQATGTVTLGDVSASSITTPLFSLTGDVNFPGDITVTGISHLGDVEATSLTTPSFIPTGNVSISGDLSASNATITGDLSVAGTTTLANVSLASITAPDLTTTGDVTVGGDLTVTGTSYLNSVETSNVITPLLTLGGSALTFASGSYTPTVFGGPGFMVTYTGQTGYYTKIGRLVKAYFDIKYNGTVTSPAVAPLRITLPFANGFAGQTGTLSTLCTLPTPPQFPITYNLRQAGVNYGALFNVGQPNTNPIMPQTGAGQRLIGSIVFMTPP